MEAGVPACLRQVSVRPEPGSLPSLGWGHYTVSEFSSGESTAEAIRLANAAKQVWQMDSGSKRPLGRLPLRARVHYAHVVCTARGEACV